MTSICNIKPEYRVHKYRQVTGGNSFGASVSKEAQAQKEQGNTFLQVNELEKAIECYKKAISLSPDYADAYYNLGKAYHLSKKYDEAAAAFEKAKEYNPDDVETLVLLGECYRATGKYSNAFKNFEKALALDPASDYAKRNLEETKNLQLSIFHPEEAYKQKKEQAQKNLNEAISMVKEFLPSGYMKDMSDICVVFDNTDSMGGRNNIAQYEHAKRKITVTGDYIWASPKLVGAYLRHEFVHAKDNDPYTSIHEEQDAYEEAAKFWKAKHFENGIQVKDPEMDYVLELYNKSPQDLKNRVAEIYKLRDPGISKTSPNHPPLKTAAASTLTESAASQALKHYDIIA